jgi:hypothetical protein
MMGLSIIAASFMAASSHAAPVTFQSPTAITSTATLDATTNAYSGAILIQAVGFGIPATESVLTAGGQTINFVVGSVPFNAAPSGTSTMLGYSGGQSGAALYTGNTGSATFNTVLQSDGWASGNGPTAPQTLQIGGLTIGTTYVIDLLAADMRAGSSGRTEQYQDAISGGNASASFSTATAQSLIATFTADSTVQDIYVWDTIAGAGAGNWDTTVSAFTLYSVPEPGSYALLSGGLGMLLLGCRNRRQK